MPTTGEGRAGLMDLILPSVLRRCPPIIRSYSCPRWFATDSRAAFIRRAVSGCLKSVKGSFRNSPWGERGSISVGSVTVAIARMIVVLERNRLPRHWSRLGAQKRLFLVVAGQED